MRRLIAPRKLSRTVSLNRKNDPMSGFAYIILPSDEDRWAYIERVKKTGHCMIETEFGAIIKDVAVPTHLVNEIEFPSSADSQNKEELYGSLISWIRTSRYNMVAMVAIYMRGRDMEFSGEYSRSSLLSNKVGDSISERSIIEDDLISKSTVVTATSGEAPATQEIRTKGAKKSASYKQDSSGAITEHADSTKLLTALDELGFSVVDGNTVLGFIKMLKDKTIQIDSDTLTLGSANLEPAVKGTTLVNILSSLVDALLAMTNNTVQGPTIAPPLNFAQFTNIKAQLDTIKSTKLSVE
jgi:hypothetical protein